MKRNYFISGLVIIGIALIMYAVNHKQKTEDVVTEESEEHIQVSTLSVGEGYGNTRDMTYSATVESMRNTTLKANVSGTITQLPVYLGSRVSVGQVVAVVESPESASADSGLRSVEIKQAEVRAEQMKKAYQEAKRSYDNNKTHANEVTKQLAKLDYESAQVSLQSIIDGRIVKSPVSGIVTSVNINKNENVSSGQDILTISQGDTAKISFYVSQSDLKNIHVGKQVSIVSEADGQSLNGSILRIAPQADASTGKFFVEAYPEAKNIASLIPGTIAKVAISVERKAGDGSIMIPLEALLVGQNNNTVFMLHDGDDRVIKTQVEVIRIYGGMAEIAVGNFSDTDRIVISNARMLNENDKVAFQDHE